MSAPPIPELLAQLRAAAAESSSARGELLLSWESQVVDGPLDASVLADVALALLATLSEEDGSLDMVASDLLRRHGGAGHLEPLRALRPSLRPRQALRDWRIEVGRAIATIEARADGRCVCGVEASHGGPVKTGAFTIDEERSPEPYVIEHSVRCVACERSWIVREEHGYHYPVFYWRALVQ